MAAIPLAGLGQAVGITDLGGLNGGRDSMATGVSGDGTVVVGDAFDGAGGYRRVFRWAASSGMVDLGALNAGQHAFGTAVSRDGSVVVGYAHDGAVSEFRAFRWTEATGMVSLGVLDGSTVSFALGVNSDGSVVVGEVRDNAGAVISSAFRWTQPTGMTRLGTLSGDLGSRARGVSADGNVVVGSSFTISSQAFRWTQATGMQGLGFLNGGTSSDAYAASADGYVVVGVADDPLEGGGRAFRWTPAGGMVSLGVLAGGSLSHAYAVNRDGSVVVGRADGPTVSMQRAFRWTQATGMQTVESWLRSNGIRVVNDATLYAFGVSDDGSVVVGGLESGYAFVARVSSLGSGLVTMPDLQPSISGNASTGPQAANLGSMVMHGAHSRPLGQRVQSGKSCLWTAGDVGRDDHGDRDGSFALAEIGGCRRLAENVQGSLSLGTTRSRQDLVFNGGSDVSGTYAMAELLGRVPGTNVWPSVALLYQAGDADVRRGYLNAGVQDFSTGHPDVQTTALRLRLDWEDAARLLGASFTPYADVSAARTRIEAYTETGGGFPARFDERTEKATELRLGTDAAYPLSSAITLHGRLEAAHRSEKTGAATSGTVLGLLGFDLPGQEYKRDWLRAGVGISARLGDGIASAMANATSEGAVPSYWLNLSYWVGF